MTKEELRKIYLQKRLSLSEPEYNQLNFQLFEKFFTSVDLSSVKILSTFLPLEKNKEPDTWPIIERIRKEFQNIRISLPRVNDQTGELENFIFQGRDQLQKNKWGIQEPKHGVPIDPVQFDLVLIPMLIFDKNGHRVGYGKGFYDKLLPRCKPSCYRVGLSFYPPVETIEDINDHDQVLTKVITPEKVFNFY